MACELHPDSEELPEDAFAFQVRFCLFVLLATLCEKVASLSAAMQDIARDPLKIMARPRRRQWEAS